jgi:hypothetical protein
MNLPSSVPTRDVGPQKALASSILEAPYLLKVPNPLIQQGHAPVITAQSKNFSSDFDPSELALCPSPVLALSMLSGIIFPF